MLDVAVISGITARQELLSLVQSTGVAASVAHFAFTTPAGFELERLSKGYHVVLLDMPTDELLAAVSLIEMVRSELPSAKVIVIGDLNETHLIVSTMRAGASDFFGRPVNAMQLRDTLLKMEMNQGSSGHLGKLALVLGAKGGSGATTVAVSTAAALAAQQKDVVLADFAVPGDVSFQLKLEPSFSLTEALRNLHRLDAPLLGSFTMEHQAGFRLLAGVNQPDGEISSEALLRVAGLLRHGYEHVLVDVSGCIQTARALAPLADRILLVMQPEVSSIWNAIRVRRYLGEAVDSRAISLVLNRYRKLEEINLDEVESAVGARVLCTVPNQYRTVTDAVSAGVPAFQRGTELARCFTRVAHCVAGTDPGEDKLLPGRQGLLSRLMSLRSPAPVEVGRAEG